MASFSTLTILSGATTSNSAPIQVDAAVVSIQTPAALTGTSFTLQGSQDGVNFGNVYVDGIIYSFSVAASTVYKISPSVTVGLSAIRLVSNAAEGADRAILVSTAKVA